MCEIYKGINRGKSKAILDFAIAKQNNSIGITISSRINMHILEKNLKESFKMEAVREAFNNICSNTIKILEVDKNNDNILKIINNKKIPILSLSMIQIESIDMNERYKIVPFFDLNIENIIKISKEENCKKLKSYLENNKDTLEEGGYIIVDTVMKSIIEYQQLNIRK